MGTPLALPLCAALAPATTASAQDFGCEQIITTSEPDLREVIAADLDGDGDRDALSVSDDGNAIVWYENTDGLGAFGPRRVIAEGTAVVWEPESAFVTDLDGDGDRDVLSASMLDDKIAWYENTDGLGTFGPQQVITAAAFGANDVIAADLDGDGDQDVVASAFFGSTIAWYENTDGAGAFGPEKLISTLTTNPRSVLAADLDSDGDQDVATNSSTTGESWHENLDGLGSFGPPQVFGAGSGAPLHAADLNGDGLTDILAASIPVTSPTLWYPNAGLGTFAPPQLIVNQAAHSIAAGDFDGDGDQDVLLGQGHDDEVAWFENTDGAGSFGPQQVVSDDALFVVSVFAADLEGDGDLDAFSASVWDDKVAWYRWGPCPGGFPSAEVVRLGTPPNPAAFLPGVTSGPIPCEVWDPVVDHSSFLPFALSDVMGISTTPINVPSSIGTFLCTPPAPSLIFAKSPAFPFQIPVPGDCALIGTTVCAQVLSRDFFGNVALTNALDVTIGAF